MTALLGRLGDGLMQQAWVVEDRAAAEDAMSRSLGCGEFVDVDVDQEFTLRGRTVRSVLALGFARSGNLQIELIEPRGGEGVHVEFLERHGAGLHHLGFLVEDMDASVAAAADEGFDPVMSTELAGVRLCYLDTLDALGIYVELIEDPAGVLWATMPWRDDVEEQR